MDIIENISTLSMAMSINNAKETVSLSVLKNSMQQSTENLMKIMEMSPTNVSPAPEGTSLDLLV